MIAPRTLNLLAFIVLISLLHPITWASQANPIALRIATFNVEDVRTSDLQTQDNPKLKHIASIIQQIRPNILLLNELAFNQDAQTTNADLFVQNYLAISQGDGLKPIDFTTYSPHSNTGIPSGHDLDNSGSIISTHPQITPDQTADQRAYGNDCFGFGTFPGQYAMALLVDPKLTIQSDQIRTFQNFLWKDLPGCIAPTNPDGTPWYTQDAWDEMRLSSKNFVDVPILLPNGSVLHALISHPTPPAFDGPEGRNKLRNHDEIKLIRQYIDNADSLVDDAGKTGGLADGSKFVIMGDLNADPSDGSSIEMTMLTQILTSSKVADDVFPSSEIQIDRLDSTDTSRFRLRVDYVLPSQGIQITKSGIWRTGADQDEFPSDHFPVWIEVVVP